MYVGDRVQLKSTTTRLADRKSATVRLLLEGPVSVKLCDYNWTKKLAENLSVKSKFSTAFACHLCHIFGN